MKIHRLSTTPSTNTWASEHASQLELPAFVVTHAQTAGRGQRGNSWESSPGLNITGSLIFKPDNFDAKDQFAISEAVSLAIVEFLWDYGVAAKIKWPNDIYAGDKKICGILVEHVVTGRELTRSIAGMGININQTEFLSDAPNPVSLKNLTGKHYDLEEMVENLVTSLQRHIECLDRRESLHATFLSLLWRNDGEYHRFYDRNRGEEIDARILTVEPNGMLHLLTTTGERRIYAFKEIEFKL